MSTKGKVENKPDKKQAGKPTIRKIPMPNPQEQPKMTEEQAFASWSSQVISNAILDLEATKGRIVDSLKGLIQQLNMMMNAVKKLEEENSKLKKGKEKKK